MNSVTVEKFGVVGREARTTNAKEMSGQGVIGELWRSGVPTGPVVAVYSEYESNKDGAYNYLLGRKIKDNETVPQELAYRTVAAGPYLHWQFTGSVSPEAVVGLWREVWAMEQEGKIRRAYQTDFELYDGHGVELYIGVKPS